MPMHTRRVRQRSMHTCNLQVPKLRIDGIDRIDAISIMELSMVQSKYDILMWDTTIRRPNLDPWMHAFLDQQCVDTKRAEGSTLLKSRRGRDRKSVAPSCETWCTSFMAITRAPSPTNRT